MTATLIQADQVLTLDAQDTTYQPGYLLVEDDRLVGLGPIEKKPQGPFDQRVDLGRRLVMPGLVNAHTHTPMTLFRGQAEGRQVSDVRNAIAHCTGGGIAGFDHGACTVTILGAA